MIGIDSLVDLADKLGVIAAVKDKLIKHPDPAADKLVTALEELAKVFETWEERDGRTGRRKLYDYRGATLRIRASTRSTRTFYATG